MGRKSIKAKEKKLLRKEEQSRLDEAQKLVNAANKLENPLNEFPVFTSFKAGETNFNIEFKKVEAIDANLMQWICLLLEKNMKHLYEESNWGWSEKSKIEELNESSALYLIAKQNDVPVGFSHFRFDLDYGYPVLYCYELQLNSEVQGKGLGKHMMRILELMAFKNSMSKIILTVFKHNPGAVKFFKILNYEEDITSPEDDVYEQWDYIILSKPNRKAKV